MNNIYNTMNMAMNNRENYLRCEKILEHVEITKKTIKLTYRRLSHIPSLSRFTHLLVLDFSNNNLHTIPELNNTLKSLNCSNNYIHRLPRLNANLKLLDCSFNEFYIHFIYILYTYTLPFINHFLHIIIAYFA